MRRTRLYRVVSVVIRQRDLGEADRILTLYTRERGKLSAVAKGIKRPRSKLAGSLQSFSHAVVQMAAGRSLDIVTQAQAIDGHYRLREDMNRYAHASYVAELLDALTDEGLSDMKTFELLLSTLAALDRGEDSATMVRSFELKLLRRLGYGPEIEACAVCGGDVGANTLFSVWQGGVVCRQCAAGGGVEMSDAGLRALRNLWRMEMDDLSGRCLSEGVRSEVGRVMRAFVDSHLDRPLRSAAFLIDKG